MKVLDNILSLVGYSRKPAEQPKRAYDGGKVNRSTNDWPTTPVSFDADIYRYLVALRTRARHLTKNTPHGRRFMRLLRMNIPGPKGFKFQSNIVNVDASGKKSPDKPANMIIEEAWKEFCKPENCTVTCRQSMRMLQHISIMHLGRDGEILIRIVRDKKSKFGIRLQMLEPEMLDEQYNNSNMPNNHRIVMGVELDEWRRPVAYHLKTRDSDNAIYGFSSSTVNHEAVPASEIIHCFDQESAFQTRGISWFTASMIAMHQNAENKKAGITRMRVASNSLGFLIPGEDSTNQFQGTDTDTDGNIIVDNDPQGLTELPRGYKVEHWDTDYPGDMWEAFTKSIERSEASGLDVSYMSLTGDLNSTSYGSGRIGMLDEREGYKERQEFYIENVLYPIFTAWLESAMLGGKLVLNSGKSLPFSKFDKFNQPVYIGRRWAWIDPEKDAQAWLLLIKNKLKTRTQFHAEEGDDFEEIMAEIEEEEKIAADYNIDLTINDSKNDPNKPAQPPADAPKDETAIVDILKKRNGVHS